VPVQCVVIGGMKCGTSAFHQYLTMHPEVYTPRRKNLYFFTGNDNWEKGVSWYESFFPLEQLAGRVGVEISTEYTKYPAVRGVPERMKAVVPDAKLIYLVRDPLERLVSHYIHQVGAGKERRDISEALREVEGNPYVDYSRYYLQLEQYESWYPPERILLLTSEELRWDTERALRIVWEFLGVNPEVDVRERVIRHTREEKREWNWIGRRIRQDERRYDRYKYFLRRLPPAARVLLEGALSKPASSPQLRPGVRRKVTEVLEEDVVELRRWTGRSFPEWQLGEGVGR